MINEYRIFTYNQICMALFLVIYSAQIYAEYSLLESKCEAGLVNAKGLDEVGDGLRYYAVKGECYNKLFYSLKDGHFDISNSLTRTDYVFLGTQILYWDPKAKRARIQAILRHIQERDQQWDYVGMIDREYICPIDPFINASVICKLSKINSDPPGLSSFELVIGKPGELCKAANFALCPFFGGSVNKQEAIALSKKNADAKLAQLEKEAKEEQALELKKLEQAKKEGKLAVMSEQNVPANVNQTMSPEYVLPPTKTQETNTKFGSRVQEIKRTNPPAGDTSQSSQGTQVVIAPGMNQPPAAKSRPGTMLPDLSIEKLAATPSASCDATQIIKLNVRVRNQGKGAFAGITGNDALLAEAGQGLISKGIALSALAPNQVSDVVLSISATTPVASLAGKAVAINVQLNKGKTVTEADYANNAKQVNVSFPADYCQKRTAPSRSAPPASDTQTRSAPVTDSSRTAK